MPKQLFTGNCRTTNGHSPAGEAPLQDRRTFIRAFISGLLAAPVAALVAGLKIPLLSGIAGETRRQLVRELVEAGRPVPDGLDAPVLDEETRQAWGRIHPSHMGDEFLPRFRNGEVEIASIPLASVTADQISVRARRSGKRIGYCVVDEYESGYICRPAGSMSTLSLRELIALMEGACEGGTIFPALKMNLGSSTPEELEEFVTVSSDFYGDLGPYYRALTDAWLEERTREGHR